MRGRIGLILLATAALTLGSSAAASAAAFTVNTAADSNDGSCTAAKCSLRDAVIASNATPGPNTITLPAGDYKLTLTGANEDNAATGDLDVKQGVTITGVSPAQTTIDGNGSDRIFQTFSGVSLTLSGVTLTGGAPPASGGASNGGAIFDNAGGNVSISNSVLTNNTVAASSADGGAIWVGGGSPVLDLTNVVLSANKAIGTGSSSSGFGGAIYASGLSVTMTNVSVAGNVAGGSGHNGFGGAVDGNVTATGSAFTSNQAGGGGTSADGFGGAIDGGANVNGTTFHANTAGGGGSSGFGGAVHGPVTATNSAFTNNQAGGGTGGEGFGGAIDGNGTLIAVSLTGNSAGGGGGNGFGGGNDGNVTAFNSTIADNSAGGGGGYGFGGGINGNTTLAYGTVAGNSAQRIAPNGHGGGVSGSLTSIASIVAENTSGSGPNCDSAATSHGYNIENGTSCGFAGTGDLNADPLLAATANNGGPGSTRRLLAGSPAINHVPTAAGCPATDERGVTRPQGPACDTGAYEAAAPSATTGSASISRAGVVSFTGSGSNPDAVTGSAYFQYGTSSAYGSTSPAQTVPPGAHGAPFSFSTTNLKGRTTYHYRLVVVNPDGTSFGADAKYKTPATVKLSHVKIKPHSFKPGHRATISFRSSLKGSITFTVLVHRHHKWVKLGSFTHRDKRGKNHLRLPRRVGGKKLKAGSYRLSVTASSPFKLPTTVVRSFKIT